MAKLCITTKLKNYLIYVERSHKVCNNGFYLFKSAEVHNFLTDFRTGETEVFSVLFQLRGRFFVLAIMHENGSIMVCMIWWKVGSPTYLELVHHFPVCPRSSDLKMISKSLGVFCCWSIYVFTFFRAGDVFGWSWGIITCCRIHRYCVFDANVIAFYDEFFNVWLTGWVFWFYIGNRWYGIIGGWCWFIRNHVFCWIQVYSPR